MSKAPSSASSYDGSGGWFKIKDWGMSLLIGWINRRTTNGK
jgi:hypothetical protein